MTSVGLRWFAPAPARRLALLRILIGGFALGYVFVRAPHLIGFGSFAESRFDPVFVVGFALDTPLPAWAVTTLVLATIAAGAGYVAGWRFRWVGPAFAILLLWVTTYRNSWGLVLHTENLMVIQVFVVGFVAAADAYSLDARRGSRRGPGGSHWMYGWPIRLLMLATVLSYFVAGIAKARNGGWDWVSGDVLRNQIAYDNLRKLQLGDFYSPIGGWLTAHAPWIFPPMAFATQIIELGAPFALLSDRLGRIWAGLAWLFHAGIVVMMSIVFPYQLLGIAFAPFFEVERGFDRIVAWWSRRRAPDPVAAG